MADDNSLRLFGFEIKRARKVEKEMLPSIVPPLDEHGAGYVTAAGAHYGTYVDIDGDNKTKDEQQQIMQYRAVATHPEVDAAIEDIINESIRLLRASIPTSIQIDTNLSKKSDIILADPNQIHQVFINLCTNAAHAMENDDEGELKISVDKIYLAAEK